MEIPILLEPIAEIGYRATAGQPFGLRADGATPDEAMRKLRAAVDDELKQGKRVLSLEVSPAKNPWLALAGTIDPADPLVQEWKDEMAAYRSEKDANPDGP